MWVFRHGRDKSNFVIPVPVRDLVRGIGKSDPTTAQKKMPEENLRHLKIYHATSLLVVSARRTLIVLLGLAKLETIAQSELDLPTLL